MALPKVFHTLVQEVKSVAVQGATSVADATLHEFVRYVFQNEPRTHKDIADLRGIAHELGLLRPTEPLTRNLLQFFLQQIRKTKLSKTINTWTAQVEQAQGEVEYLSRQALAAVTFHGAKLVHAGDTIFTHCHSSVAENILTAAHRANKRFTVYHTETRPLYQGRVTDTKLRAAHVRTIMVADSAAAFLISDHSGDDVSVDWVLLGADSVARDGSVLNKVGSFGIALAAYDSKLPVYVAASLLKMDWLGQSRIEMRNGMELWPNAPKSAQILNYAFDRVPAHYITGVVTEFGILPPSKLAATVRAKYPWLTKR